MKRLPLFILLTLLLLLLPAQAFGIEGILLMEAGNVYNLKEDLTKDGTAVTLTNGTTYIVQIAAGRSTIFCTDEATEPTAAESEAYRYDPKDLQRFTLKVESATDPYCWIPGNRGIAVLIVGEQP